MPSIDTHLHVFRADSPVVAHARYRPGYSATLAQWRALAARSGVNRGVLVQPSFLGTDHHDLLAALATDPASLRGVATLEPDTATSTVITLHHAGVRGLRWNLVGEIDFTPHADGRWDPLLRSCAALGWHLELHTDSGRLAPLLRSLPPCPIPVVIDHFGKPVDTANSLREILAATGELASQRPVYVKLSAPYRLPGVDHGAVARAWRDLLGPQHLLWGSDWPWTNHEGNHRYEELHSLWRDWFGNCERDAGAAMARQVDKNACRVFDWPMQD